MRGNGGLPLKIPALKVKNALFLKPQLQILTLWEPTSRDIEAPSRPVVISSTACRRDAVIGIAIFPIRSVSPLKRGPNDIAIFPSAYTAYIAQRNLRTPSHTSHAPYFGTTGILVFVFSPKKKYPFAKSNIVVITQSNTHSCIWCGVWLDFCSDCVIGQCRGIPWRRTISTPSFNILIGKRSVYVHDQHRNSISAA